MAGKKGGEKQESRSESFAANPLPASLQPKFICYRKEHKEGRTSLHIHGTEAERNGAKWSGQSASVQDDCNAVKFPPIEHAGLLNRTTQLFMKFSFAKDFSASFIGHRPSSGVNAFIRPADSYALLRVGDLQWPLPEAECVALLHQYGAMVQAVCHRALQDAALAEDATQEVFVLLLRKAPELPPDTVLSGWLYRTADYVARDFLRTRMRRRARETRPETIENLMPSPPATHWQDIEPMLDDAMHALPERQRSLVLLCYFQKVSQRAAALAVGCSESVASRDLAGAIESLRRFFSRRGVAVSGPALIAILAEHAAQAGLTGGAVAAITTALLSAKTGVPVVSIFTLMTNTTKALAAATTLAIASGVAYLTTTSTFSPRAAVQPSAEPPSREIITSAADSSTGAKAQTTPSVQTSVRPTFDEATQETARGQLARFHKRTTDFFLMANTAQVQALLLKEFGIRVSADEIAELRKRGDKHFFYGLVDLWAARQPLDALRWAANSLRVPNGSVDIHESIVANARKGLHGQLSRAYADEQVPDAPGKAAMLDLVEALTAPETAAARILKETDSAHRKERLRELAQGWSDEKAIAWARANLEGADKSAFLSVAGYDLALKNAPLAFQILQELQGQQEFGRTFAGMMNGLVQVGGLGASVADLLQKAQGLDPQLRAHLFSQLGSRWVRNDRAAAVEWVNGLTNPVDLRAALPMIVAQLPPQHVQSIVQNYLANPTPALELALIEGAAPATLMFSTRTAQSILGPLLAATPQTRLRADSAAPERDIALWRSVTLTAQREAEYGQPATAMQWLEKLPFATPQDQAVAAHVVINVWKLKSQTEAATWVQNSALNPTLKSELMTSVMK